MKVKKSKIRPRGHKKSTEYAFYGEQACHRPENATPTRREEHILLNFMGAEGFWRFALYEISRTPFLSYSHFQGV